MWLMTIFARLPSTQKRGPILLPPARMVERRPASTGRRSTLRFMEWAETRSRMWRRRKAHRGCRFIQDSGEHRAGAEAGEFKRDQLWCGEINYNTTERTAGPIKNEERSF